MKLSNFDHLRSNPAVQFKEEVVNGVEVVIPCYMIANPELWETDYGVECRGHVFRKDTGECISMALHKFFNINENEKTQVHNIHWNQPIEVLEKRDGSMITGAIIDGKLFFKTKKSFYSDVAKLANELAPASVKTITELALSQGYSLVWEFTHPDWKIVIDYGEKPTWTLIAVREFNGNYLPYERIRDIYNDILRFVPSFNHSDEMFNLVKLYPELDTYDKIQESVENLTGMEGYVVAFPNGFRVKTKCNWYNLRHHINTDLRERDVARMVIAESLDDIKSTIVESNYDLTKVEDIERQVVNEIETIRINTEDLLVQIKREASRKDAALAFKNLPCFRMAMQLYDGKEPDYKKYWVMNYLPNYSLRTVYSEFNHDRELEEA